MNREGRPGDAVITIGMPVHNGEKYIREAIDSVLGQSFADFRLLISDNASTDSTADICASYAERDARICYTRQQKNIGGHRNFDFVLQEADSPFFSWLACDDALDTRYLESILAAFQGRDGVVLISSDFEIVDGTGQRIRDERLESIRPSVPWRKGRVEFFQFPISNVYLCIYGVMRTAPLKSVWASMEEPKMLASSELPFLARMACEGQIISVPGTLRQYRRHAGSMYSTEQSALRKHSALRQKWVRLRHANRLRADQFWVVLRSDKGPLDKARIIAPVLGIYTTKASRALLRRIRNASRSLRSRTMRR